MKKRNIQIKTCPPPMWALIKRKLPAASLDEQIFAFGDTIYWKHQDTRPLQEDLIAHETKHLERQKFSYVTALRWWFRYLTEPTFRIDEEIVALQAQLDKARTMTKDRTRIYNLARTMAKNLSSPVYGNAISEQEAFERITS